MGEWLDREGRGGHYEPVQAYILRLTRARLASQRGEGHGRDDRERIRMRCLLLL